MWRHQLIDRRLRDKAGEEGSDDGGSGAGEEPITAAQLESMIAQHGDAKAALRVIAQENYSLRESRRKLRDQIEGGVVLKGDDVANWKVYQELGKPEDLKASLETKAELEQKEQQREREERVAKAAKLTGYKPSVLQNIRGVDEIEWEFRTERRDGKDVEVAFGKGGPIGDTPKRLEDHAKEAWPDHLPALQETDEAGGSGGKNRPSYQRQSPNGSPPSSGPADVESVVERKRTESGYAASI